jgi:flagellar basal body rod protein FlgG
MHGGDETMKRCRTVLILVVVLIFGGILACTPTPSGGTKPVVEILSPPSGSRVAAGEEVEVQFRATEEKAVVRVELEVEGEVVDTQTSPSAEGQPSFTGLLRWTPTTPGTYNLMVYAYNSDRVGSAGVGIQIEVAEGAGPVVASPTPEEVATPTSPAPTPTTAVGPSPTAVSSPGPAGLLFEDDFSDPASGWEVGDYNEGKVGYADGYYYVISSSQNNVMWGVAHRSFGDVDIEVEATQFSAPDNNNNSYGVQCRLQSNNDGYHLLISGDGFYSIQMVSGGSFTRLVDWTGSDVINQGDATNEIQAICDGSRLALYCNGQLLAETNDSTFTQGDIALMAETLEADPTEIHFDNLKVYAPAAEGQPTPTPTVEAQGNVLLEDDFSDPSSGWQAEQYTDGSVGYQDGYYYVTSTQEGKIVEGTANRSFSDVDVEVDATQFSAPSNNNNAYGVECRLQSNRDGYSLLISGDGYYSIQKYSGGSFTRLVDWTGSDVINQGNATNQLRVVCDGSYLALYCNGELLGETNDSAFTQGDIALVAATYESDTTEIHFDNLKVYQPGR